MKSYHLISCFTLFLYSVTSQNVTTTKNLQKKQITIDNFLKSTFSKQSFNYNWVTHESERDGYYVEEEDNKIILKSIDLTGNKQVKVLIDTTKFIDENKQPIIYDDYSLSPDLQYIALTVNSTKLWSKSSFASYYIFDLQDPNRLGRLINRHYRNWGQYNKQDNILQTLVWSPKGHNLAFVQDNNIYAIIESFTSLIQVTKDGKDTLQNGIPDWVYEEEIWPNKEAIVWDQSGTTLAYLTFDSSNVQVQSLETFTTRKNNAQFSLTSKPYSSVYEQRYPKPGFNITQVKINVAELTTGKAKVHQINYNSVNEIDPVVTDLQFSKSSYNDGLIIRFTNRFQDRVYTSVATNRNYSNPTIVRQEKAGQDINNPSLDDKGWYENRPLYLLPKLHEFGINESAYIDFVIVDGFTHLALFSPITASKPKRILTKGDFDVVSINGLDVKSGTIYYSSAETDSTVEDIYSIKLDGSNKVHLTKDQFTGDSQKSGTYSMSSSALGGFVVINYNGPSIPWSRLTKQGKLNNSLLLTNNTKLATLVEEYNYPTTVYSKVNVNGNSINAFEIRPYDFDPSKKYNVVFYIYGGPNSQQVTRSFNFNLQRWLVGSRNDTIVVTVDGRGTGRKGRKFMVSVREHLGEYEADDVISAGQQWAKLPYVNPSKIGVWGKSYGGYMTLRTLELQPKDLVFSFGASFSPVSDWKFYDSLYTERYMFTPQVNAKGYNKSAINNFENFKKTELFLTHGTRDDNVHQSNSMYIINNFAANYIISYDFTPVIDDNHYYESKSNKRSLYLKLERFFSRVFKA
ncbi:hypothetical protein K502DRAFT_300632 [Neoconidiobolus thromboides FSU 785]|nr:hypothetical protein K502DRAFT_300632 [Neoconidiobolus thromboides FSU 785]